VSTAIPQAKSNSAIFSVRRADQDALQPKHAQQNSESITKYCCQNLKQPQAHRAENEKYNNAREMLVMISGLLIP
jgi:hypothetical protein